MAESLGRARPCNASPGFTLAAKRNTEEGSEATRLTTLDLALPGFVRML